MIPYDIVYVAATTIQEALEAFSQTRAEGLDPLYYAGGTEILSFTRQGKIRPGALIDIKDIGECRQLDGEGEWIVLGAAVSLNELIEADLFALLSETASRVADHTIRNRLTLGGNLAGRLPYRETVLPLLVSGAELEIAGPRQTRWLPVAEVFDRRLLLATGELLVRLRLPREAATCPRFHRRRQRGTRVDYPLVTCCLLAAEQGLRLAVGGACSYPLRKTEAEKLLNDPGLSVERRVDGVVKSYAEEIRGDFRGSAEYRRYLLGETITAALESLGGRQ